MPINGKDDYRWNFWSNGIAPSQLVVSDPGSSVSKRAQAVNSPLVQLACWSATAADDDQDWHEEWCYDWESDWMEDWHEDRSWRNPEEQSSEWHDDEGSFLVCGAAGPNPNPKQQDNEKVKLMIDRQGKTVGHPGSKN